MFCNKCKNTHTRKVTNPETGEVKEITYVTQGRVFVDRIFSERKHVELFCMSCGHRWMLDKAKSKFAAWLVGIEAAHANAVTLTSGS